MPFVYPSVIVEPASTPGLTLPQVYPGVTTAPSITVASSYVVPSPSVSLRVGETSTFRRIGDLYLEIVESFETRTAYLWVGGKRGALPVADAKALQDALTETF